MENLKPFLTFSHTYITEELLQIILPISEEEDA